MCVHRQGSVGWSLTGPLPLLTGDAQSILNYHGGNRELTGPMRLIDRNDSSTPPVFRGVSGRESYDFLGGGGVVS